MKDFNSNNTISQLQNISKAFTMCQLNLKNFEICETHAPSKQSFEVFKNNFYHWLNTAEKDDFDFNTISINTSGLWFELYKDLPSMIPLLDSQEVKRCLSIFRDEIKENSKEKNPLLSLLGQLISLDKPIPSLFAKIIHKNLLISKEFSTNKYYFLIESSLKEILFQNNIQFDERESKIWKQCVADLMNDDQLLQNSDISCYKIYSQLNYLENFEDNKPKNNRLWNFQNLTTSNLNLKEEIEERKERKERLIFSEQSPQEALKKIRKLSISNNELKKEKEERFIRDMRNKKDN